RASRQVRSATKIACPDERERLPALHLEADGLRASRAPRRIAWRRSRDRRGPGAAPSLEDRAFTAAGRPAPLRVPPCPQLAISSAAASPNTRAAASPLA